MLALARSRCVRPRKSRNPERNDELDSCSS
jgi:hypothetical protein